MLNQEMFGDRLKNIRGRISQQAMAERLGLTFHRYRNLETGESRPTIEDAERVVMAFPDADPLWVVFGKKSEAIEKKEIEKSIDDFGENERPIWRSIDILSKMMTRIEARIDAIEQAL